MAFDAVDGFSEREMDFACSCRRAFMAPVRDQAVRGHKAMSVK